MKKKKMKTIMGGKSMIQRKKTTWKATYITKPTLVVDLSKKSQYKIKTFTKLNKRNQKEKIRQWLESR